MARDPIGVKPFYYYTGSDGFAFSSELKSLIQLVPHARQLNYSSIQSYLTYLYSPGESIPLCNFFINSYPVILFPLQTVNTQPLTVGINSPHFLLLRKSYPLMLVEMV